MILHVDANSFYASCERLFRPDLANRPVVVLSNNDGIIVALSQEAKDLGLKRGDAYFKVRTFCESHNVAAFSSNYTLYADISYRLNSIYSLFAEKNEIYSIDESFLFIPDMVNMDYTAFGRSLKQFVWRQVGIPVSVGIAPTKTLAKICNKLAKKSGGVFSWLECDKDETLRNYKIENVWNIGPVKSQLLKAHGYFTALSLKNMPLEKAKKFLTITGMNTVLELNGKQAIGFVSERELSKNICSSRSFSKCVYELDELKQAVDYFCTFAVRKLRSERQAAKCVYVTLATAYPFGAPFNPEVHYFNSAAKRLLSPTSYLPEIEAEAFALIRSIYRYGYGYRKASVNLLDLSKEDRNLLLFETDEDRIRQKYNAIMDSMAQINGRYGKETLVTAPDLRQAAFSSWRLRQDLKSPDYTTDSAELPESK